MLLIHPPVAKPGEPPSGIARLSGALKQHGVDHAILDANIEGILYLLNQPHKGQDTWSRRSIKNLAENLAAVRDRQTYKSPDRYSRAVRDLNRVLAVSGRTHACVPSLADYEHEHLSPLRSSDLIRAAENPEQNIFYPYFRRRLPGYLVQNKSSLVGFSLSYLSQALCTFAMIGFIKREFPDWKVVLGGGLVSSWMKRPGWRDLFRGLIDHVIAGPGEQPLLTLLGAEGVPQQHYQPDYDPMPNGVYLSPGFILPYSGSSGCYWNECSFCPEVAENNSYHPVRPERAMSDLGALTAKHKPALIHLLDNSISPELMRALAEQPLGFSWYGFARISKEFADLDYCMQLRKSGCVMLKLGLESGDQGVLDKLRKGIDLGTASIAFKNLRKAGIAAYVYLLFGTPPETAAEARKTLDFVVKHRDAITFLNLAIFNMPACGQEAREYEVEEFYKGDLSLYTGFRHPHGWNRKLVRRFLDSEFKRDPAISSILKNDPPIFTSNHAAFFADEFGK